MVLATPAPPEEDPFKPGGGGMAMRNSNANSGSTKALPKGSNQKTAQNAGPI
jgi:hypothetical protein